MCKDYLCFFHLCPCVLISSRLKPNGSVKRESFDDFMKLLNFDGVISHKSLRNKIPLSESELIRSYSTPWLCRRLVDIQPGA